LIFRTKTSWIGKNPGILASRGLIGFTALSLYFWTVTKLDLGTAVMLNYTSPIFALFWARFLGGEHPGRASRVAVLFAFTGVYFLSMPHFDAQEPALIAGLLSGLLAGSVHVLIRRSHEKESALTIIFYFTAISTIGSLFYLPFGFKWPGFQEWLALAGVGVGSFYGQIWMTIALRRAPAALLSPFSYLTPLLSFLFGIIFWKERLTWVSLLGVFLIILGGSLVSYFETRREPESG